MSCFAGTRISTLMSSTQSKSPPKGKIENTRKIRKALMIRKRRMNN
jgi:hypothetical protein